MATERHETAGSPIAERNRRIRSILEAGGLPVMPFEIKFLRAQFDELVGEQNELSKLLGQAMEQSSETWHDNAPADAINLASRTLSIRARNVVDALHGAHDIGYPPPGGEATIGSILGVQFPHKEDTEHLFLTGATSGEIDETISEHLPPDTLAITVQSPLGAAALGTLAGHIVEFRVNDKPRQITVAQVRQLDLGA